MEVNHFFLIRMSIRLDKSGEDLSFKSLVSSILCFFMRNHRHYEVTTSLTSLQWWNQSPLIGLCVYVCFWSHLARILFFSLISEFSYECILEVFRFICFRRKKEGWYDKRDCMCVCVFGGDKEEGGCLSTVEGDWRKKKCLWIQCWLF